MDKEKDLRDWRLKQCNKMLILSDPDTELCCDVLGEIFGNKCRNDKGELCRYFD